MSMEQELIVDLAAKNLVLEKAARILQQQVDALIECNNRYREYFDEIATAAGCKNGCANPYNLAGIVQERLKGVK